jgi:glycosyltransferase involved in cell wall biosynthesis
MKNIANVPGVVDRRETNLSLCILNCGMVPAECGRFPYNSGLAVDFDVLCELPHGIKQPELSVIVCTRNREGELKESLEALARSCAAAPEIATQVVLVDSASTDGTSNVLLEWAKTKRFPVDVVRAHQSGLSRARNVGLSRARGRLIAFTDDDCRPEENWIRETHSAFLQASGCLMIGGRVEIGNPLDLPITIRTGNVSEKLDGGKLPSGFIMGANMAFNRETFEKIGDFDERFGAGSAFKSAEDTDYIFRATRANIPVVFTPKSIVYHFHGRRSAASAEMLRDGYNFGDGALMAKHFWHESAMRTIIFGQIKWMISELIGHAPEPVPISATVRRVWQQIRGFGKFLIRVTR